MLRGCANTCRGFITFCLPILYPKRAIFCLPLAKCRGSVLLCYRVTLRVPFAASEHRLILVLNYTQRLLNLLPDGVEFGGAVFFHDYSSISKHCYQGLLKLPNPVPKEVTQEREQKAWLLRQQLKTEKQIADELGIAQTTVSAILRRMSAKLAASFVDRAAEIRATQSAQLEYLAAEALAGWERSKLNAETLRTVTEEIALKTQQEELDDESEPIRVKQVKVPAAKITTTATSEGQAGDPRFIDQVRGALADIRDIWGLEAAKKSEIMGADGQPFKVYLQSADPTVPAATPDTL